MNVHCNKLLVLGLSWMVVASSAFAPAFTTTIQRFSRCNIPTASISCRQQPALFMSTEGESEKSSSATPEATTPVPSPPVIPEEPQGTQYPVNLPSPLLLATSMVLAIASTGSVFELAGGNPQFGFGVSAAIAAVGIPLSLFLIYAAILKGMAETEEDDKKFTKRTGGY
mmetsp:Transcript_13934/g.16862  ORF Transcript_13934/g.16862 Transcript_13934/m.16862 type:complete len:169 (+) Transcript_13934:70-576(+)